MIDEQIIDLKCKIARIEYRFRVMDTSVIITLITLILGSMIFVTYWFVLIYCFLILLISGLLAIYAFRIA